MSEQPPERRDSNRRPTGKRGQATRRRLLEATRGLLDASSYRSLRVVDVARVASTSPATFYQYFPDAESAVMELAEAMASESGEFLGTLVKEADWDSDSASIAVVGGFLEVWEAHGSLIGVIDLVAAGGEPRFREVRTRFLNRPTEAFAEVIAGRIHSGQLDADVAPAASAGVLVAMLAHVAAHHHGLVEWGAADADLRRSLARVVRWSVTGREARC